MDFLKLKPQMNRQKLFEIRGTAKISHEPINLNYWHVQFYIYDFMDKIIEEYKNAAYIKSLSQSAIKNL